MPKRGKNFRHIFSGGWATDFGLTAEVQVGNDGLIRVPFLYKAENVVFELDGGPRKMGGTTKLNSTTIESGEEIRGGFDYWRHGTGGSPTQKRIVVAGTKILKDDADGDFSDVLFTGQDDDRVPSFAQFDDIAFICSDSTTNRPRQYNQTTAKITQTGTTAFTGGGLNDATFSGSYTSDTGTTIEVEIQASVPTPDTFKWRVDAGAYTENVGITGAAQVLGTTGISVTFVAIDGHTIGDKWTYTIGLAPNVSFMVEHKNRMWGAGDPANPSTLYYCVLIDPEDWHGSGSGTIAISPNDGDGITGIASYKNELWVFKGPYKGSIHRITGSSPTGDDSFARTTFITGLGAAYHNLIFRYKDDLGFVWSDGTIRSLKATASFGDFHEATLSLPINGWLSEHLNFSRLKYGRAVDCSACSFVLFTFPIDSSTDNNFTLLMDYRFDPPRFATWDDIEAASLFTMVDSNAVQFVMAGGNDGFVRKLNQTTRTLDSSTSIAMDVKTPFLNYGDPMRMKTLQYASLGLATKGSSTVTFSWQRDDAAEQFDSVSQAGGDVLGPAASNVFTLNSSALSGDGFADRFLHLVEGGEFRSIRFGVQNAGIGQDVEIHSIGATIGFGADSVENN